MYVCVHVNNPSLNVPHVVSLTAPTKTAAVGSNPFDDDEGEEEDEDLAVEQQTTVNHISVNKEEIKTLVNRRKHFAHPQPPRPFLFPSFVLFDVHSHFFVFVTSLLPSSFLTLSPPSGGRLFCCSAWSVEWHCTQSQCVRPSLLTVPCLAEH